MTGRLRLRHQFFVVAGAAFAVFELSLANGAPRGRPREILKWVSAP